MVRTRRQCDLMLETEWNKLQASKSSSSSSSGSVSKAKLNVVTHTETESDFGFDGLKEVTSDSSDQSMGSKQFLPSEVIHLDDSEEEEKVGSAFQDLDPKFVVISDTEKSDSELGVSSDEEGAASDLSSGSDADDEETISDFEPDLISSEEDDSDDEDFDDECEADKEKVDKHKKKEGERMDIEESKIRVRTRSATSSKDVGGNEVGLQEEERERKDSDKRNKRTMEGDVQSRGAETVYDIETTSRLTRRRMTRTVEKVNFWGSASNKLDIYSVMVNSIWNKDAGKDGDSDSMKKEKENETIEKSKVPSLPVKFTFGIHDPEPVIKSEYELELDTLWDEFDFVRRSEEVGSSNTYYSEVIDEKEDEPSEGKPATVCKHDFVLDEEVGIYCRFCPFILIEVRDMMPDIEKLPSEVHNKRVNSPDHHNNIPFDQCEADFDKPCNENEDGTVWGLIPGTKGTLYPHQQEGFEFLWKNLAGSIDIKEMKKMEGLHVGGGCIISHAMGTGKTWLSIAFLKSYLKRFPDCRPVIMAPAGLLLTWEEELQKWKAGIPFHNLSSKDLSGNEDSMIVSAIIGSERRRERNVIRMAKLYSWINKKSVLGISYSLFVKLVGGDRETYTNKNSKILQQIEDMKKILIEKPGLVVFDEGHTPRNHNSKLWKALTKLQTQKRIILSGTPFQNNFRELYTTLELVRPASIAGLPPVNLFGGKSYHRPSKRFKLGSTKGKNSSMYNPASEVSIEDLKKLMSPFLHRHNGNILQKRLPGLKDCVVVLKPAGVQQQLIKIVEGSDRSKNILDFEHKLSLASIHPSLFLECSSAEEISVVNDECGDLTQLKLNYSEGVKTRFVVEFLRIMQATEEKVLIFSQFLPPLRMIMDQLSLAFTWSKGTEILYIDGKLEKQQRQQLIRTFNDPKSKAKVLLASTKACSEGISLVGASRVVLLDVVWNPSVERQAISRAYRIGQKRLVYTYHLIIKDTTEWDKYMKQVQKQSMAERIFSDKSKDGNTQVEASFFQDDILDELYEHSKLTGMFDKVIYHPKEATHLIETAVPDVVYF